MTEILEKLCLALQKESSAFICIGFEKPASIPTPPASLVFSYFGLSFQEDFYFLEQFHILTGTLYIYQD